jgi:hypothetical protein
MKINLHPERGNVVRGTGWHNRSKKQKRCHCGHIVLSSDQKKKEMLCLPNKDQICTKGKIQ